MFLELIDATPILEAFLVFALAFYLGGGYASWAQMVPVLVGGLLLYGHLRYAIALSRNLFPISYVQYYVPGVLLYPAALIVSWWKNTQGAVAWKGREYPAKDVLGNPWFE